MAILGYSRRRQQAIERGRQMMFGYSNGDHRNADSNATQNAQGERAAAEAARVAAAQAGRGSRRI